MKAYSETYLLKHWSGWPSNQMSPVTRSMYRNNSTHWSLPFVEKSAVDKTGIFSRQALIVRTGRQKLMLPLNRQQTNGPIFHAIVLIVTLKPMRTTQSLFMSNVNFSEIQPPLLGYSMTTMLRMASLALTWSHISMATAHHRGLWSVTSSAWPP